MIGSAVLSPCGRYRYALTRTWGEGDAVTFVCLNPSTADAVADDPTLRRCLGFAQAWGFGCLHMANLFALRVTDPLILNQVKDPIGPGNDDHLDALASVSTLVVAAWGVQRLPGGRHLDVRRRLPRWHYLRLTRDGYPAHPLYLPRYLTPVEWVQ